MYRLKFVFIALCTPFLCSSLLIDTHSWAGVNFIKLLQVNKGYTCKSFIKLIQLSFTAEKLYEQVERTIDQVYKVRLLSDSTLIRAFDAVKQKMLCSETTGHFRF